MLDFFVRGSTGVFASGLSKVCFEAFTDDVGNELLDLLCVNPEGVPGKGAVALPSSELGGFQGDLGSGGLSTDGDLGASDIPFGRSIDIVGGFGGNLGNALLFCDTELALAMPAGLLDELISEPGGFQGALGSPVLLPFAEGSVDPFTEGGVLDVIPLGFDSTEPGGFQGALSFPSSDPGGFQGDLGGSDFSAVSDEGLEPFTEGAVNPGGFQGVLGRPEL